MGFCEMMAAVHRWFEHWKAEHASQVRIEVVQDEAACFHAFFETASHMAELIVEEPDFAPYRWVSLQVVSKSDHTLPVFVYHDCDSDTTGDVIHQLNAGLNRLPGCMETI